MIDTRLGPFAHSEPEKQHDGLEHVSKITERALYPVIKLRSCASCGEGLAVRISSRLGIIT